MRVARMGGGEGGMTGETPGARHSGRVRWAAVGVLVVAAGAFSLLSFLIRDLRPCRDVLAQSGDHGVVTVCAPTTLSDYWPVLVAILLLLWPDISELSFGGFSIKRQLRQQEQKIESLRQDVLRVSTSVSQTQQTILLPGGVVDWKRVESTIDKKMSEPIAPGPGTEAMATEADDAELRGTLMSQLFSVWETLRMYLRARSPEGEPVDLDVDPRRIEFWRTLFARELRLVQASRNTLAHRPDVLTTEDMREAVEVGTRLLKLLRDPRTAA